MKPVIEKFIEELKAREEILGILVFGSYARGDQRENSDVDVLALVNEGAWRDVITKDGQIFEMVYASLADAKSFYEHNPNDAVQQWNDGQIVYDKNGVMKELQTFVYHLRDRGKPTLDKKKVAHFKFDKEDKISALESLKNTDFATANLYLQNLALETLALYFDLRQIWTPAPKQRLKYLRKNDSTIGKLYDDFYLSQNFDQQLSIVKEIVRILFHNTL